MRLYLSGPITNDPHYERKFKGAKHALEKEGYDVINPAELTKVIGKSLTYSEIMNIDRGILARCDALIQIPGWEKSRGCNIEYGYVIGMDKLIISLEDLLKEGAGQ